MEAKTEEKSIKNEVEKKMRYKTNKVQGLVAVGGACGGVWWEKMGTHVRIV